MGCSPWGHKESDTTKQLTLSPFYFGVLLNSPWTKSPIMNRLSGRRYGAVFVEFHSN